MTLKALVVITNGFEDIETVTPVDLMRRANMEVTLAGLNSLELKGSRGIHLIADTTLDKAKANSNYDALVIPGGPQAEELAKSEPLKELILSMNQEGKLIASICASPALVLAPTGVLKGKKATCFKNMEHHFSKETIFKESAVVMDGNIITSRGAGTAYLFGLAIVEALLGEETKNKIAQTTLFVA